MNKATGKRYIGISISPVNHRISRHLYAAKIGRKDMAIACAIRKYGLASFSIETIETAGNYEELLQMEAAAIKEQNTMCPSGYNVTAGGRGARRACSQETKALISAKAQGRLPWNIGKRNTATIARHARTRHIGGARPGSKPWNFGKKTGALPESHRLAIADGVSRVRATRFWNSKAKQAPK